MSRNKMFVLNIQNEVVKCLKTYCKNTSWLYFIWFGCLNFGRLDLLSRRRWWEDYLPSITPINFVKHVCLKSNFKRIFQKKLNSRTQKSLEFIHVDICGLIKPNFLSKNNYFLLFINDYSRKTWVYFLK